MESTMRSKCVMILGMVGVIVLCGDVVVGQCSGMGGLIKECGVYVKRSGPQMNPSRKCCEEIKNADVACVCNHLTNHMLQLIDIQKLHNVADSCGRPIPSGTKCGDEVAAGPKSGDVINSPPQHIESQVPPKQKTDSNFQVSANKEKTDSNSSTQTSAPIIPTADTNSSTPFTEGPSSFTIS
ncbi:hypothetical protein DEO72_LG6g460 [Vigna unguiculata]|uniref:Bifunctional inhibitor/plant lipid transfer protein/seed storage helical domain-containing protein n=1 Tax=Vigna unguiculata TaxID=3917 RepID=A0A4D6M717_VIGUN|nr:hypothetical protein DEO72_LG6g460 [Vigna unguiculata]